MKLPELVLFWGKARPIVGRQGPTFHPLIFHSLDVAAVGQSILGGWPSLRARLASALGLDPITVSDLLVRLLALHDLGKFGRSFQAKSPSHFDPRFGPLDNVSTAYDHASGGYALFRFTETLRHGLPAWPGLAPLAAAIMGHHGAPPRARPKDTVLRTEITPRGIEAAAAFAGMIGDLLPATDAEIDSRRANRASFPLSGFAVLCDWIGSNEDWFPYQCPGGFETLAAYWAYAQRAAADAVDAAEILPARPAPPRDLRALTGRDFRPSPLQEWAAKVSLPEGPLLAILEDETGSGKTEAALMLAHRLITAGRAEGLYVALPTMATANAMFGRLAASYRRLFAPGAHPSIALAHGRRDLIEGFRRATLAGGYRGDGYGERTDDPTASAACAEWIADDRRRAFLADAGAGTIDQAALAVLPAKYQSLRLFGLGKNVLVIDEVHAYDDYVRQLVEGLLQFHAAQGGSAILLSATLPVALRSGLVRAFCRGVGASAENAPEGFYPCATSWSPSVGTVAVPIATRPERARNLPVRLLSSLDEAIDLVVAAARNGQAAVYIRNTVADAFDAYDALRAQGLDPVLFHSQFALVDRLAVEQKVIEVFGPRSTAESRHGRILVATQVVEQSLDLDFDFMVTDLAPIDLVIQRAGRLWRHERLERSGYPELFVTSPDPVDAPDRSWFARVFPRAAYVYQHHGRLWLTARVLKSVGEIRSPSDLRALVEAVYGDTETVPPGLAASSAKAEGKEGAASAFGRQNVLKLASGYDRDGGLWDTDERTPTRLVDQEQIILRLARVESDRIVPWAPVGDDDLFSAWRLSEVGIPRRRIAGEAITGYTGSAVREAKSAWTRYDDHKLLVVMRSNENGWIGELVDEDGGAIVICYLNGVGLRAIQ